MQKAMAQKEAVRLAREVLGDIAGAEVANYVRDNFGLTMSVPVVEVFLAAYRERPALEQSALAARERIERWRAENPEEAKKLAALAKRKEAARRKKAAAEVPPAAPDSIPVADTSGPSPTPVPTGGGDAVAGVSASLPTL